MCAYVAAAVLLLSASTECLLQRLSTRLVDPSTGIVYGPERPPPASLRGAPQGAQREDDAIDVMYRRIRVYNEALPAILQALNTGTSHGGPLGPPPGILEVDASRHVDDVTQEALKVVGPLLRPQ